MRAPEPALAPVGNDAPADNVSSTGNAAPESKPFLASKLSPGRLTAAASLIGIAIYASLFSAYQRFYAPLGLHPEDAGVSYVCLLTRSLAFLFLVAIPVGYIARNFGLVITTAALRPQSRQAQPRRMTVRKVVGPSVLSLPGYIVLMYTELPPGPRYLLLKWGVDARDPWSRESLRVVESTFLQRFGDGAEIPETIQRDFQQFLGEGMVRTFLGEWVTLPGEHLGNPDFGIGYCIRYESAEHLDVANSMLEMSLSARTGRYWAALFETNALLCAS